MVSSNWDRVSLGDVCSVEAGAGFPLVHQGLKDQEFPFFKVGDMNTAGNEKEMHVFQHSISEEIRKKLRATAFPAGTIVFPKIGAAIATNKKRMIVKPSCVDNNVMALIPSENLDSSFLFYLLLNKDLSDFANTGNPPSIRQSNVEEWAIPLPPLTEQKRIASLLARADRLRQLRRTAHDLGDALLQSVFLEMFGDPGVNPKKWDISPIEDLLSKTRNGLQTGPFGSSLKRHEYVSEGIPVWGINNLGENKFIEDEPLFITEEKFKQLKNYTVENGDIFVSRAGTVGRMCVAYPSVSPSIIGTNLVRISLDFEIINPEYFTAMFSYFGSSFASLKMTDDENAYSFINPSILRTMRIPVPPLSLQEEFAGVVARVESLRGRMGESARGVEGLFESLLAQSFDGGR